MHTTAAAPPPSTKHCHCHSKSVATGGHACRLVEHIFMPFPGTNVQHLKLPVKLGLKKRHMSQWLVISIMSPDLGVSVKCISPNHIIIIIAKHSTMITPMMQLSRKRLFKLFRVLIFNMPCLLSNILQTHCAFTLMFPSLIFIT